MGIKELFVSNKYSICDVDSDRRFTFSELKIDHFDNEGERSLIFIYLDNTLSSVSFLINSLCSVHVLALFSNDLSDSLKDNLENLYSPLYVYDLKRQAISGYERLTNNVFKRKVAVEFEIDQNIKLLLSTSGTTGSPKLVKLSEENIISNAKAIASYLPIESSDIVPLNLPLNYSYGLSILTSNCLMGSTIVCGLPDILSREFWSHFSNYGFSTLAGVPFVYEMLDRIGFLRKKYTSLRYMTQAGGRLRDSLILKFALYAENNDIEFFVMYGQTEATARMSYMPSNQLINNIGSIGQPIPGGQFNIDGKNNELIFRGPNVFGGYAKSKEDLRFIERNETLRTGDLAGINENGFYIITGRIKRFIKLFGNRINLDEIQSKVSDEFKRQIICCGIEDKKLVLVHQKKINAGEVKNWLSRKYKIHQSSIDFLSLQEIPLTQNGKVNYQQLMEIYGS